MNSANRAFKFCSGNFANCFRGCFSNFMRRIASYLTNKIGKTDRKQTQITLLENLNRLLANPTEVKNAVVLRQPMKYISVSGCRYIQSRMQYIFNRGCSIYSFFRGIGCLRSSFYFYPFIIFRNSSSLRIGMLSARAFSSLLGPMFSPARMKLVFFEILPTFFPPCFSIISLYSSRE